MNALALYESHAHKRETIMNNIDKRFAGKCVVSTKNSLANPCWRCRRVATPMGTQF